MRSETLTTTGHSGDVMPARTSLMRVTPMVHSVARINAVLEMTVRDHFVQGRLGWVRLHCRGRWETDPGSPTGITAYLDNGGSLENIQAMATHESPRTTKFYD